MGDGRTGVSETFSDGGSSATLLSPASPNTNNNNNNASSSSSSSSSSSADNNIKLNNTPDNYAFLTIFSSLATSGVSNPSGVSPDGQTITFNLSEIANDDLRNGMRASLLEKQQAAASATPVPPPTALEIEVMVMRAYLLDISLKIPPDKRRDPYPEISHRSAEQILKEYKTPKGFLAHVREKIRTVYRDGGEILALSHLIAGGAHITAELVNMSAASFFNIATAMVTTLGDQVTELQTKLGLDPENTAIPFAIETLQNLIDQYSSAAAFAKKISLDTISQLLGLATPLILPGLSIASGIYMGLQAMTMGHEMQYMKTHVDALNALIDHCKQDLKIDDPNNIAKNEFLNGLKSDITNLMQAAEGQISEAKKFDRISTTLIATNLVANFAVILANGLIYWNQSNSPDSQSFMEYGSYAVLGVNASIYQPQHQTNANMNTANMDLFKMTSALAQAIRIYEQNIGLADQIQPLSDDDHNARLDTINNRTNTHQTAEERRKNIGDMKDVLAALVKLEKELANNPDATSESYAMFYLKGIRDIVDTLGDKVFVRTLFPLLAGGAWLVKGAFYDGPIALASKAGECYSASPSKFASFCGLASTCCEAVGNSLGQFYSNNWGAGALPIEEQQRRQAENRELRGGGAVELGGMHSNDAGQGIGNVPQQQQQQPHIEAAGMGGERPPSLMAPLNPTHMNEPPPTSLLPPRPSSNSNLPLSGKQAPTALTSSSSANNSNNNNNNNDNTSNGSKESHRSLSNGGGGSK